MAYRLSRIPPYTIFKETKAIKIIILILFHEHSVTAATFSSLVAIKIALKNTSASLKYKLYLMAKTVKSTIFLIFENRNF